MPTDNFGNIMPPRGNNDGNIMPKNSYILARRNDKPGLGLGFGSGFDSRNQRTIDEYEIMWRGNE